MAIARDASTTAPGISSATSVTWSHTCTGSNLVLVAFGYIEDSQTLTGATYNGVAMSQVDVTTVRNGRLAYSFILVAPATGAHNVVISASGTGAITGQAISYTGAKQTAQPDASNKTSSTGTTNSLSVNVVTVAANSWIAGFMVDDNGWGGSYTNVTGTGSFTRLTAGGWNGTGTLDTNGPIVTPASTAVGWSNSNTSGVNSDRFLCAVSIAPFTSNIKSIDGNTYSNIKSLDGNLIANVKSFDGNT